MNSFIKRHLLVSAAIIIIGLPLVCSAADEHSGKLCYTVLEADYPSLPSALDQKIEDARIWGHMGHSLVARLSDDPQQAAQQAAYAVRMMLIWRGETEGQARLDAQKAEVDALNFLTSSHESARRTIFQGRDHAVFIDLEDKRIRLTLSSEQGYAEKDRHALKAVMAPLQLELESIAVDLLLSDQSPATLIDWLDDFSRRAQLMAADSWAQTAKQNLDASIWPVIFSHLKWRDQYPPVFWKTLSHFYFQLRLDHAPPQSISEMRELFVRTHPTLHYRSENFDTGKLFDSLIEQVQETDFNFSIPMHFTDINERPLILNVLFRGQVSFTEHGHPYITFASQGFSANPSIPEPSFLMIVATDVRTEKWINTHDLRGVLQALTLLIHARSLRAAAN